MLDCEYCMYSKSVRKAFSPEELAAISDNVGKIRSYIDRHADDIRVISLTGGEPTLFPEIIREFHRVFPDKKIRVSTNGLLIDKIGLDDFSPDRLYFAVTLDGIDLADNRFRFKSQAALDTILSNIDLLLKRGFSVEILTVLSQDAMAKYLKLLKYFENRYPEHIENGTLWCIPIELVNYENLEKFRISSESQASFVRDISENIDTSPMLSRYREFFSELVSYYSGNSVASCGMYRWGLHFKYLRDSLWTKGNFSLYGCGSR